MEDEPVEHKALAEISTAMADIVEMLEARDKQRGAELAKSLAEALAKVMPKQVAPVINYTPPPAQKPTVLIKPQSAKSDINLRIGVVRNLDGTAKTYLINGTVSQASKEQSHG
jgi:hypothetical protein